MTSQVTSGIGTFIIIILVIAFHITIINGCGIYSMTTLLCMVISEGDGETADGLFKLYKDNAYDTTV